ncbi:MAG: sodium:alanine symporter family protein [Acidobacteria bacterium]|nr:MAG: sodium:alanine symporter family protein [Acidobacteriota bacterium]
MAQVLFDFHRWLNGLIWGWAMIIVLLGVGTYLTILTRGVQFRKLGFALREVLGKVFQKGHGEGTVSPFQAVATALASTVGVGNIAGVATAIFLGGPGALFWLLVSGVLGMCTKFVEVAISLRYREPDETGTMRGGAMYVLSKGLGMPWLGTIFAILTAVAAFGIGNMVQANSVSQAINATFSIPTWLSGVVIAGLTALVILGGIKRIAEVTQILVPFMCGLYLLAGLFVLVTHLGEVPRIVSLVLGSAFAGHAAVGGFGGAVVRDTIRYGVARGLFSNEAGLGSAPMAHAAAVTDHPIRQALYGIFEVFVDTILVCTVTGFVILATNTWQSGLTGAALSAKAFETGLPGVWGDTVITIALLTFAFSTLIGWSFYGETAAVYLVGVRAAMPYRILWVIFAYFGAVGSLHLVWDIADTLNGLMAIPNLIAVLACSRLIVHMQKEFFAGKKSR